MQSSVINTYPIYDLSSPHFCNVELLTKNNEVMKGQFVQVKVVEDDIEYLFPAEQYCFLPENNREVFWKAHKSNKGEFKEFPEYIKLLSLNDIAKITIVPKLIA